MDEKQIEQARAAAIKENKCFSKGRLRDEFRMKPKPNAEPVAFYKNGYGGKFGVYQICDCMPIRSLSNRPASEKQKRARAILSLSSRLQSRLGKASNLANEWLSLEPLIIDTETTGTGPNAQVIELAVLEASGQILFNTRLRPSVQIEPGAYEVHGIRDADLVGEPIWPDIAPTISNLLHSRYVIAFNVSFDSRLLKQTAAAFGSDHTWLPNTHFLCAMELAVKAFGSTNRHGSISLAKAAMLAGVTWKGQAHSAAADALATSDLISLLAKNHEQITGQLEKIENER